MMILNQEKVEFRSVILFEGTRGRVHYPLERLAIEVISVLLSKMVGLGDGVSQICQAPPSPILLCSSQREAIICG